ncbi:MAG: UDP-glucose 4-epimerase GalE [Bacteroidetes bacterium]|nr:UDP-glucose 4-epimerase GalE [Bacteroidota bacterium]MCB0842693.1 UDP-glucose 4-epimerase GalE [Bacteroidota bacterium]MCB0852719.1 UDP-glucose 4-epimerase GalE [Bacteroidota bacterium]
MTKILITGGCGYIGSHTAIELLSNPEIEVISVDNLINSSAQTADRVGQIAGRNMKNYQVDVCDKEALSEVFEENPGIEGVIHFAALKAVGESVEQPLRYYQNNLLSLINILDCCEKYEVKNFIFSSSCTVYGEIDQLPVTEQTPTKEAASPYGNTKLVGERIIKDFIAISENVNAIALRYFNPVGAHDSGLNGEDPINKPNNLVPVITRTASGMIPQLTVFGGDYATRDGSCVRDYIHVVDIAEAHVKALEYLMEGKNEDRYEYINLGSGNGVTVLEAIQAFEKVAGLELNYVVGDRRPGDVGAIYSDSSLAKEKLGWEARRGIEEMMASAWKWQMNLNEGVAV